MKEIGINIKSIVASIIRTINGSGKIFTDHVQSGKVPMKLKLIIILFLNLIILFFSIFTAAGCIHDLKVMQEYNEKMQQSIAAMLEKQEKQASEMRQVKTESEIMYRLAMDKLFVEEEE